MHAQLCPRLSSVDTSVDIYQALTSEVASAADDSIYAVHQLLMVVATAERQHAHCSDTTRSLQRHNTPTAETQNAHCRDTTRHNTLENWNETRRLKLELFDYP